MARRSCLRPSLMQPALLALLVGFASVGPVGGQETGEPASPAVDELRGLARVAGQKLEAEVRDRLREAERLAESDRPQAAQRLRKLLGRLEGDLTLSEERRDRLTRMLRDRLRVVTSPPATEVGGRPEKDGAEAAEQERLRRLVETINRWRGRASPAEGSGSVGERAARGPEQPSVRAARRRTDTSGRELQVREIQGEREGRAVVALREVERSGVSPKTPIEYPADWKERTKGRSPATPLTPRERALLETLNSTISVRFHNSPLDSALDYLQTRTGLPIAVDVAALEQAGVALDTPVSLDLKRVAVRTVLRKMLHDHDLEYTIYEEVIQVTTPQKARQMMVVRAHPVGALIVPNPAVNLPRLIDLIQTLFEPASWQVNGGPASITFHPNTMSLIIKQSTEFHAELNNVLRRLE